MRLNNDNDNDIDDDDDGASQRCKKVKGKMLDVYSSTWSKYFYCCNPLKSPIMRLRLKKL